MGERRVDPPPDNDVKPHVDGDVGAALRALADAIIAGGGQAPAQARATAEVPAERLDRLLVMLERLVHAQERLLARDLDSARRALSRVGPTTPEAEARVEARMNRIRGKK